MDITKAIQSRYSCRAYTDAPVTEEDLEYVKECVRLAPSACNRQPWKFRIIRSAEGKRKLQECYNRDWFKTAPMYILATVLHDEEWVRSDGKQHGNIDIAIAVEHLCLAATERNLGTCWVCAFDAALCSKLFSLPDSEEPAVLIPIGHKAADIVPKKRKTISEIFVEE